MSKYRLPIAVALLCCASANAASPPVGADDLLSPPDPQIERPGSSGPGQGELEMEQELQLAGILIPWGGDADLPAERADAKRDGLCVFRYRYVTRNTDRTASHPTSTRITRDARNGAVLSRVAAGQSLRVLMVVLCVPAAFKYLLGEGAPALHPARFPGRTARG